ncbi:MAG: AMMECR1 domain-containing protein, partial [Candidatus Eremiobacterota bacterium]
MVLDDSLVSGSSMLEAIRILEEEGYSVEGCLALVGFPHRGGVERLQRLGYRVEVLFDVYADLGQSLPEWVPGYREYGPERFGPDRLPDGLPPAVAARRVAETYLRTGKLPLPPSSFDRAYDGRGGVFVSVRSRATDRKLGRSGYWLFDPAESQPGRDLVVTTVMALECVPADQLQLEDVKFCTTFFGPLEPALPADLDYPNRGVVVRSLALPHRMGGALPNTEVFTNEFEQYQHARFRNAGLGAEEPHELLTHTLTKCLEPGDTWPPFGNPRDEEPPWPDEVGERIAARAQEILKALEDGRDPPDPPLPDLAPQPLFGVAVSLYRNGLAGCGVAYEGSLEDCLRQAARTALFEDHRYADRRRGVSVQSFAVHVSLLIHRSYLGQGGANLASRLRRGMDSLAVAAGDRQALFLSHVSVHRSWDWSTTGQQLLAKAGLPEGTNAHWFLLPTVSWLRRGDKQWRVSMGYPERRPGPTLLDNPGPLARYLALPTPDGLPALWADPCTGTVQVEGSPARRLHALWALTRAADDEELRAAARRGLETCLEHLREEGAPRLRLPRVGGSKLADALLLLTLLEGPPSLHEGPLLESLRELLRPDGRVVEQAFSPGVEQDLDCLSGAVLLALAEHSRRRGGDLPDLSRCLEFYRRRFRLCHPWAMVGWHGQAWTQLGEQEFVGEMCDWAIQRQHRKSGAFLCDLDPDGFSFHTGFLCEGLARSGRYPEACQAAFRFMERL